MTSFEDIIPELKHLIEAKIPELIIPEYAPADDTIFGSDNTGQLASEHRIGEALDGIKSTAKMLLHHHNEICELRQMHEPIAKEMAHLEMQIKQEERQTKELQNRKMELEEEQRLKIGKLHEMKAKVDSKSEQLEEQKQKLDDFRTKIAKHLGLKINISTDGTYIISLEGLTKIDDECCTCEIAIDTSIKHHGEYKVLRSSPDLGHEELQRIEKCLNETNDVAGLIATLRKRFKECI